MTRGGSVLGLCCENCMAKSWDRAARPSLLHLMKAVAAAFMRTWPAGKSAALVACCAMRRSSSGTAVSNRTWPAGRRLSWCAG